MTEGLTVETNWLLDITFQRDRASLIVWNLVQAGSLDLFIPSFCIAEAVKAFESLRRGWGQLMTQIAGSGSDLRRSPLFETELADLAAGYRSVERMRDRVEFMLWQTLKQAGRLVHLLELRSDTAELAESIRDQFALVPADSLVLAAVEQAGIANICSRFMSRDVAFRANAVRTYMQSRQIEFYPEPARFLSCYFPDALRQ